MKTQKRSNVAAGISLLTLLSTGVAAIGVAQTPPPPPGKMPQHHDGMQGMGGMMEGSHHLLAMAYRDNLVTFARALQTQVTRTKVVNLDLARPAVAEMRRSLDQIQQHHQAHMTMMGSHPDTSMSGSMQRMETHLGALGQHLTALEAEVNATTPDSAKVLEHTAELIKACAGMSMMPAEPAPQ